MAASKASSSLRRPNPNIVSVYLTHGTKDCRKRLDVDVKLEALAERDGWVCWVCDNEIDPNAFTGSPHAASVDHIVPRAKGGQTTDDNVRLAHRKCNTKRGSHVPELEWPGQEDLFESAPLWPALQRLMKHPTSHEKVAFFVHETSAQVASAWVVAAATRLTGVGWQSEVELTGNFYGVKLRTAS